MKKTLLIVAAALVAGITTSEAQVYSANVVGYVNVVFPPGTNVLVANPLTTGNDVLTNVLASSVPGTTQIQLWNPGTASFTLLTFSGPVNNRHWKDGANVTQDNLLIQPGTAFFVNAGGAALYTNTFVGNVVPLVNSSVTNSLAAGLAVAIGSLTPYSGYISNTAALNLVPPGTTQLQKWNPATQSFALYTYSGPVNNRTWKDGANNTVYPQLGVAEGFFLTPGGATPYFWTQTFTNAP